MEIDVGLPLAHPEECLDTTHFLGALLEGVGQAATVRPTRRSVNSWSDPAQKFARICASAASAGVRER